MYRKMNIVFIKCQLRRDLMEIILEYKSYHK